MILIDLHGFFRQDGTAMLSLNLRRFLSLSLAAAIFAPSLVTEVRAGSRPSISIVFVVEGDEFEGPRMVQPMPIAGKTKYFRKIPMLTQKNIKAFYPFPGTDGTMGVALRVNDAGWRNVREAGSMDLGKRLAVLVNGRLVQTIAIDNPTKDDNIVVIWKGLREDEIAALKRTYPEIGSPESAKAEKKEELPANSSSWKLSKP